MLACMRPLLCFTFVMVTLLSNIVIAGTSDGIESAIVPSIPFKETGSQGDGLAYVGIKLALSLMVLILLAGAIFLLKSKINGRVVGREAGHDDLAVCNRLRLSASSNAYILQAEDKKLLVIDNGRALAIPAPKRPDRYG